MTSKAFPQGQVQPYLTVGPGVYFSRFRVRPAGGSDSSTDAGVKVGGGLTYMLNRNVGLLGEYRFSHFSPRYQGFGTDISTHRLQFGATFRF
jgi:opacity protein-like surface antigen